MIKFLIQLIALCCPYFFIIVSFSLGASETKFSGYLKSYALLQDSIDIENGEGIDSGVQSQNALRLMFSNLSEERGNFEVQYEIQPLYYSNGFDSSGNTGGIGSTVAMGANRYRIKDIKPVLSDNGDKVAALQNLDRFNYQINYDQGELTVGRQVVSFGSARFVNPTDLFIPFVIQTLNQEYRIGIDAIRHQWYLGDFAVFDTGIIVGEDGKKENSAIFLRGKNSLNGNDFDITFIKQDKASLLGGGLERAIADFGFWFESAYMKLNYQQASAESEPVDNYWRTSVGADYALTGNLIVMLEYHYNGVGSNDPSEYHQVLKRSPYQNAGVFLLGKQYLIPAINWTATPLVSITASGFFNLSDQSVFINISSETSWTDNLYSDFGVYLSSGSDFIINEGQQHIEFGSEFGAYPLSLYGSLRYYF